MPRSNEREFHKAQQQRLRLIEVEERTVSEALVEEVLVDQPPDFPLTDTLQNYAQPAKKKRRKVYVSTLRDR